MLIGLLSDSHGRPLIVRRAVQLFDQLGVAHTIHCGDVGGMEVFEELAGRPLTFVWGNTDVASNGLIAFLHTVGITPPAASPTLIELAGRRIAVFHGHEPGFEPACRAMDVDYIAHGHTHLARDDRRGKTRIINPGALHRAATYTVATLDLLSDQLEFYEIPPTR
jgi:putative phosphoesterase